MRRDRWNDYATYCYTYDVAHDQRSAGGVHVYQVRRTRGGQWQTRIKQTNGMYTSYGQVTAVTPAMGEAHFVTAQCSHLRNNARAKRTPA